MSAGKQDTLRDAAKSHAQKHHRTLAESARAGGDLASHTVTFHDEVHAYLATLPEDERRLYWEFLALQLSENAVAQHHQATAQERKAVAQAEQRGKRFMLLLCGAFVAVAVTVALLAP